MAQTEAQKKAAAAKKAAEDAKAAEAAKAAEDQAAETEAAAEEAAAEAEAEAPVKAAAMPEAAKGCAWYRNGSKFNVFTSAGRCMPNQTIELNEDEAKEYKGLELCQ